jgi:eukaryotic-like serine/threonine-protein kinase
MSTLSPKALEGKYEVLAMLREGGMGAIYKVRHRLLNEFRVIKVMRPDIAQSADQRKRFVREAQTATRLRHPNIVAFYDFFVDDEDVAYMVMEYIEGVNLRETIRQYGPFPIPLGLDLARQCLSAFDYLHRKGIVHRDVSPDNIMMIRDEDGTVRAKLIDLGIAKIAQATEELTAADEFIGKLRYSSPEQLTTSSAKIDSRSDLFSFGIVVYEMLTGVCPYGGENFHEIVTNRLNQPPLPFTESDSEGRLSPALRGAVMKALQKRPADRYQSALEFGKALEGLAAQTPEDGERVTEYVDNALRNALASVARLEQMADLPPTVQARTGSAGAQIPFDSRDLKFRRTIAGYSGSTPQAADAQVPTVVLGDSKGVPATASTRPIAEEETRPRKTAVATYAGVAVSAALLVAFGVWIAGRDRSEPASVAARTPGPSSIASEQSGSGPSSSVTAVADAPLSGGAPPASSPGASASAPERETVPTARAASEPPLEKAKPTAPPRPRPSPPVRVAQVLPTKPAPEVAVPPAAPAPAVRYCPLFDDTVYKQGVVRDVPAGFDDVATKAPRPDSGLMKLLVSLSPEKPLDDQPFSVVVRFENGGDARVDVQRLEESSSRGAMRPVAGASAPVTVSPGGIKELYRYQFALSGGDTYVKQFVAIDGKGDSWKTGFRLVPCGDEK